MKNNLSGQTLGKYLLEDLLKEGYFSDLYRAYDHDVKREVAVKIFSLPKNDTKVQACFIRQAEIAAALEHRHIVRIYDYGFERDINYIVMQHLTGGTLANRMKRAIERGQPHASLPEVAQLLEQVASALDYAHAQDVIHGDIKPQHVKFDTQGQAFIVDFGIGRIWNAAHWGRVNVGILEDTCTYCSPEKIRGYDIVPATDQYALAFIVYEWVMGQLPFETETLIELMMAKLHNRPKSISALNGDVPAELSLVMDRALATEPDGRYPSCMQFAQAFAAAVRGGAGRLPFAADTPTPQ